jgi:hypothetical protein
VKTTNGPITMMTPGVTSAPFSEAMPLHPKNADEVIAVNLGSSVYTLTGSITGGDVALDAGETAILVYAGSTAGWYVTWRSATGAVSYPISVDHGGTGADGTDLWKWLATDAGLDTAKTEFFLSATDSADNIYNVSIGIELPNSPGVAGDLVFRTGGSGANGSGTERVNINGGTGVFTLNAATQALVINSDNPDAGFGNPVALISTLRTTDSPTWIKLVGHEFAGQERHVAFGGGDFLGDSAWVAFIAPGFDPVGGGAPNAAGVLFVGSPGFSYNSGAVSLNGDDTGMFQPLAALDVRTTQFDALHASTSLGISLLAQTSATDGSNNSTTLVVAENTTPGASLQEWRGVGGNPFVGISNSNGGVISQNALVAIVPDLGAPLLQGYCLEIDTALPAAPGLNISTDNFSLACLSTSNSCAIFQHGNFAGTNPNATVSIQGATLQTTNLLQFLGTDSSTVVGSMNVSGLFNATAYSCSAMPAAPGASGAIYADPVTHALFITP